MAKTALITGITGQDGSYLAEFLLTKGYRVTGIVRAVEHDANIGAIKDKLELIIGEIGERAFVAEVVKRGFDEIYNLASIATVANPWENPELVADITGMVPQYFLEAIRTHSKNTKFFQASSAEMYGAVTTSPQTETTPFKPQNPYGVSKLFAHNLTELYRSQGVFGASGILFNHESPRRPVGFVTRKITSTLARIAKGSDDVLTLGNMDAMRDWGFAGEYVEAMWMTLQHPTPETFVIASGEAHTVREFVVAAATALGMDLIWQGSGVGETATWGGRVVIAVDPTFYRPPESHIRQGDISKIKTVLGWQPRVSFTELAALMAQADAKL